MASLPKEILSDLVESRKLVEVAYKRLKDISKLNESSVYYRVGIISIKETIRRLYICKKVLDNITKRQNNAKAIQ